MFSVPKPRPTSPVTAGPLDNAQTDGVNASAFATGDEGKLCKDMLPTVQKMPVSCYAHAADAAAAVDCECSRPPPFTNGQTGPILAQRKLTLQTAYAAQAERFVNYLPNLKAVPATVCINPPKGGTTKR